MHYSLLTFMLTNKGTVFEYSFVRIYYMNYLEYILEMCASIVKFVKMIHLRDCSIPRYNVSQILTK